MKSWNTMPGKVATGNDTIRQASYLVKCSPMTGFERTTTHITSYLRPENELTNGLMYLHDTTTQTWSTASTTPEQSLVPRAFERAKSRTERKICAPLPVVLSTHEAITHYIKGFKISGRERKKAYSRRLRSDRCTKTLEFFGYRTLLVHSLQFNLKKMLVRRLNSLQAALRFKEKESFHR
ncbi:uncharacterized protein MYCFIDRAFT_178653 [Pseudocercospora fijiensis CIRAD86]|uniref:Uncharacterized protein n=1 Tax=Pseudocercospora fijiensis (strain CIRAD86) TaxID=383855 RepID=M3AM25_PSEFD|nr:uncharacterized protein MYCFIDRAFT_178653 [Pseudocercospora fijiensis CIRAD86]EME78517.1 hypothetical protein MYCFIDRAFT_178653 [Pseudocercospora fijiensis CIRAD86]